LNEKARSIFQNLCPLELPEKTIETIHKIVAKHQPDV
jgi:hypothetical protein